MKQIICLLFFILSQLAWSQTKSTVIITEEKIDQEINAAKDISKKDVRKTLTLSENAFKKSRKIDYKKGMLESSNIMMTKYYDMGRYKDVVELGKETEEYAKELSHYEILSNIYLLRALSYTDLGFNDESLKSFKKGLIITDKITSKNHRFYLKSLIYNGLSALSAHMNSPIDSVVFYQQKSLETVLKIDNNKEFNDQKKSGLALAYINLGKTSNALKKTKESENYFTKALEICTDKNYSGNKFLKVSVYNEFAWLYYDQKMYDKAIYYAEKGELLEKQISSPYLRRDIYEVMSKSFIDEGKKEKSSEYMHLFTRLNDSLVNAEKKSINTPAKAIKDEQSQIYSENIENMSIITLAVLISLSIITAVCWKKHEVKLHKKYLKIIQDLENKKNNELILKDNKTESKNQSEKTKNIADHTFQTLLDKLNKFEQSQKYLKKEVSRVYLANLLNTNTKYLMEVISQHTGKNFNNYINGLRINYITEKLYHDPLYREYKISYLADVCGFASREIFTTIFKKETGVSPSYFISQLRNEKSSSQNN